MSKFHLQSRCVIYTEWAMGTQRKNDATYSRPWRDYFPIERSNQTVVQLLKTRDVHLSAIHIERGAVETGLGIQQLYRAYWPEQNLLSTIKQAIAFHTSSPPEKWNQSNHTTADAWTQHIITENAIFPTWVFCSSEVVVLFPILRTIPIKYMGYNI